MTSLRPSRSVSPCPAVTPDKSVREKNQYGPEYMHCVTNQNYISSAKRRSRNIMDNKYQMHISRTGGAFTPKDVYICFPNTSVLINISAKILF